MFSQPGLSGDLDMPQRQQRLSPLPISQLFCSPGPHSSASNQLRDLPSDVFTSPSNSIHSELKLKVFLNLSPIHGILIALNSLLRLIILYCLKANILPEPIKVFVLITALVAGHLLISLALLSDSDCTLRPVLSPHGHSDALRVIMSSLFPICLTFGLPMIRPHPFCSLFTYPSTLPLLHYS